ETMSVVEADDSIAEWLDSRHPELRRLTLERVPDEDGIILVRAAVAGHEPVVTLLDTGGKGTETRASSVPDLSGGELRSTGHGVGGTEAFGRDVEGQALEAGGARIPVERLILRDVMPHYDILVGMDTLRGSVLAVTHDQAQPVHWLIAQDQ
ncbi:MAG TPA: hypothetical protein VFK61_07690, partial [Candidatus Limnocylindria bacterium]|nr:hypothetical protein [Candidatus Limnocylindria bacterium]